MNSTFSTCTWHFTRIGGILHSTVTNIGLIALFLVILTQFLQKSTQTRRTRKKEVLKMWTVCFCSILLTASKRIYNHINEKKDYRHVGERMRKMQCNAMHVLISRVVPSGNMMSMRLSFSWQKWWFQNWAILSSSLFQSRSRKQNPAFSITKPRMGMFLVVIFRTFEECTYRNDFFKIMQVHPSQLKNFKKFQIKPQSKNVWWLKRRIDRLQVIFWHLFLLLVVSQVQNISRNDIFGPGSKQVVHRLPHSLHMGYSLNPLRKGRLLQQVSRKEISCILYSEVFCRQRLLRRWAPCQGLPSLQCTMHGHRTTTRVNGDIYISYWHCDCVRK